MKQHRYLFMGGPLDQQWRGVPPGMDVVTTMENGNTWDPSTSRMVRYHRTVVEVPGWFVPVTFYRSDPLLPPEPGTPMPGWVQGRRGDWRASGPWQWIDSGADDFTIMHEAIERRGFRP